MTRRRERLFGTLVVAGLAVGLAEWSGGFGKRVGGDDLYGMYLGKHHYIAKTLLAGSFPLWNPYEFCGLPLHGAGQGSVLYAPLVVANMLWTPFVAMQVVYALHITVLVYLVLAWTGRAGIGLAGGAVAAALAATGQFNSLAREGVDHPHHLIEVALVPAILLACDDMLAGRRRAFALLALLVAVQWLPGYPEFPLETAVLLVTVAALEARGTVAHRVLLVVAALGLGTVLASAQLVPQIETLRESWRPVEASMYDYDFSRGWFAVKSVPALAAGGFARYGAAGVFCLLLGLPAALSRRPTWVAALLWCVFATNWPLRYLYRLWPYSGLRFAWGWDMMAPIFAGCVAALGVGWIARSARAPADWLPPVLGAALVVLALAVGDRLAAGVALACALASVGPLRRRGAWVVVVLLVALHGERVMSRIGTTGRFPAPDLDALRPRVARLRRLTQRGEPRVLSAPELAAGFVLSDGLPSPTGYEPALPPRRMTRVGQHLGFQHLLTPWSEKAWAAVAASPNVAAAVGLGIVVPRSRDAPVLRAAGFRDIGRLPDGDPILYRPPMPRFHVVRRIERAGDEEESFRLLTDATFDPVSTAILEADPGLPLGPLDGSTAGDDLRLVSETPEHIILDARLASAGLLVIGDNYFPGWRAAVDRRPAPLLRADYTLRAVPIEAGAHSVDLVYDPLSFRLGVGLSAAGLVLAAFSLVTDRPRWV